MSIASGYGPDWTTEGGRVVELQRRVVELEQQLAVARAEARERSAHVAVELQRRVVELEQQLAVAQAEIARLREALSDYYHQHRCGCGHPACKRCMDDRHMQEALAAGGDQ